MKRSLFALLCVCVVTGLVLAQPRQRRGPVGPTGAGPQDRPRIGQREGVPVRPWRGLGPLLAQPKGDEQTGPRAVEPGQARRQTGRVRPQMRRNGRPELEREQRRGMGRQGRAGRPRAREPRQAWHDARQRGQARRGPSGPPWAPGLQRGARGDIRPQGFGRGFGRFQRWARPGVGRRSLGNRARQWPQCRLGRLRGAWGWQGSAVPERPRAAQPGWFGRGRGVERSRQPGGFGLFGLRPW